MFKANIEEKNNHILVGLVGDLDVYSKDDFSKFYEESLKNTNTDFIIDLEKLDYIDSTGLGMFINIYKDQKEKDKSIKIINPKENIKKLFKITDISDLFEMEE
ncbi:MAG: STAS domain-containing protein [Streptococcus mitis]|nr:STAS domain-containing protein [Streptococcus mitis]